MASGLLSLKWKNHRSTFHNAFSALRQKESYCDVTIACDGRFYSLHKFVLSTCSEYFEEMFERTNCKNPVIVLKDISCDELEALLNYMYVGEVNVVQEKLAGLIKAAECLRIKGLAVPDEDPIENYTKISHKDKRYQKSEDNSRAKRRRKDNFDSDRVINSTSCGASNNEISDGLNCQQGNFNDDENSENELQRRQNIQIKSISANSSINDNGTHFDSTRNGSSPVKESADIEEFINEGNIKSEPIYMDESDRNTGKHAGEESKEALHQELGFDDSMCDRERNSYEEDVSLLEDSQSQSVEDVIAHALPGSSGFDGNTFQSWVGEGDFEEQNQQMINEELRIQSTVLFPAEVVTTLQEGYLQATEENAPKSMKFDKTYFCPYCKYSTKYKCHLTDHIRLHTGEKPYECQHCQKKFSQKSHLKTHTLVHGKLRPFKCDQCQFTGLTKTQVKRHRTKQHLVEEPDKPYKCEKCFYRAPTSKGLKNHVVQRHT